MLMLCTTDGFSSLVVPVLIMVMFHSGIYNSTTDLTSKLFQYS
jgi:hypothetical protein